MHKQHLLFLCAFFFLAHPGWSQETQDAETLFKRFRDRLYQIKLIEQSSGETYTSGSGFQITAQGHIATNYHVVASMIHEPGNYRLECIDDNGQPQSAELLDIDVVNDLAVIRCEKPSVNFFQFNLAQISKGTRIYAMGNPYDLSMTIVEGTYNGFLKKMLYERILFSGALNPGMSGGPTIDGEGRVIGVNCSKTGDNIGFLVPVRYLIPLLDRVVKGMSLEVDFKERINRQLMANQERFMADILSADWKAESFGRILIPKIQKDYFDGWGDKRDEKDKMYLMMQSVYSISDGIYIARRFKTGKVRVQYNWLETKKLNSIQFYQKVQYVFNHLNYWPSVSKEDMADFKTTNHFLKHEGMNWKFSISARKYLDYPGLYDVSVKVASLDEPDRALVVSAMLKGVSRANSNAFIKKLVGGITWPH